ncbi:MAG: 4-hydroxythreonine-4-phosphate dehydrogenase PdxA, partial [Akkermansiaceae bacterium]
MRPPASPDRCSPSISSLGSRAAAVDAAGMPRIIITLGDPAGIGPEVIDLALQAGGFPGGVEIEVIGDRAAGTPGQPDTRSAAAALAALDEAVSRLKIGSADAVVTGPVSKQGLQSLGFPFPGQTEYFANAFGVADFGMLLSGPSLTVGLATIHEPLARVPGLLTTAGIVRIGLLTAEFLQRRQIRQPR